MVNKNEENSLRREIKTPGAIFMGLGSIIGTGIFVSIAIAHSFLRHCNIQLCKQVNKYTVYFFQYFIIWII